ncbi:Neugrin-related protein [Penicillium pulvis]|uniref:Neugrin-related protein n=1 Tax=Penicillium pulvis TaxID=1562058 RepID=UPI00254795F6|nr:Neugrin-related protein [Penicillium pulvis]KAJ5784340.1 Neugrin-related protein [Penicillium pulvis]
MASYCAASSRLALPTVFRTLFRSEAPRNLRPSRSVRSPALYQPRLFSSATLFRQVQEQSQHAIPVTQENPTSKSPKPSESTADSTPPSERSPADSVKSSKNPDSKKKNKDRKDRNPSKHAGKDKKSDKPKKEDTQKKKAEPWKTQKQALDRKFPNGWNPPKKLSPDALDGIRSLHASAPDRFTTTVLAEEFKISPESIRRILKSKWRPKAEEIESRRARWEARHERIWGHMAELGLRPMTKSALSKSDSKLLYKKDKEDLEDKGE